MKERRKISLCYFGEGNGQGGAATGAESGAEQGAAQAGEISSEASADAVSSDDMVKRDEKASKTAEAGVGVSAEENEGAAGADADTADAESPADDSAVDGGVTTNGAGETGDDGARAAVAFHYGELIRQSAALKAVYPSFSLRDELRNPTFLRLTAPGSGISVEDAFYTVHRRELGAAALQVIAQRTAEKLSNAVISGSRRPIENGAVSRAASINTFDYRAATPSQREAFKKDLRLRMARGEKVYPN